MNKIQTFIFAKLPIGTILIILSASGAVLQNILKIKPFCLNCREMSCGLCVIEFNGLVFFAWLIGLILLTSYAQTTNLKEISPAKKMFFIIDIILLCFCFFLPFFTVKSL